MTEIPLAPKKIEVRGPDRGRYNFLSNEEEDRYTVKIDGLVVSVVVPLDRSQEIDWLDGWPERIAAIAAEAACWFSSAEMNGIRDALVEWINRDDPEDERLCAIEDAQLEYEAQKFVAGIRRRSRRVADRVVGLLSEGITQ